MAIFTLILLVIIFVRSISYGIFELKQKNKSGAIAVFILSIAGLVLPGIAIIINYFF